MALSSVRTKHWTRVEYERLVDLGAFRPGERIELVGGALLVREPQGGPHATAVGLAEDALRRGLRPRLDGQGADAHRARRRLRAGA